MRQTFNHNSVHRLLGPTIYFYVPISIRQWTQRIKVYSQCRRPLSISERVTLHLALHHTKMFILQSYTGPQQLTIIK